MNICLRLSNAHQRKRLVQLCEQRDWRCAELESISELALLQSNRNTRIDAVVCDETNVDASLINGVAIALTADPDNWAGQGNWLKLSSQLGDTELIEQIQTAVNVARLAADLNNADDFEPTTRIPYEEVLLEGWRTRPFDTGAAIALHIDHGDHLYSNLDPIAATEALAGIARRLNAQLPAAAEIGIRDAANFLILVPRLTRADSQALCQQLLERFREPLQIAGSDVYLTVSIGGIWQRGVQRIAELADAAWSARDDAVAAGGNRIRRGSSKPEPLSDRIPKAVDSEEFSIVMQGQWNLAGDQLVGAEALVRWHGLDVGELKPGHFIPAAERSGTISRVGDWVLDAAGRQAATWFEQRMASFTVGINVSPQQFFDGSLSQRVKLLQKEAWLNPAMIELELTQAGLANVLDGARDEVYRLKDLGVRLCLDQLGQTLIDTDDLLRMPVDSLKIDRSVINKLGESPAANAFADQVIHLCERFELRCIAVGVETAEQRDVLEALGCQIAQGYLYSRPETTGQFLRTLHDLRVRSTQAAGS